MSHPSQTFSTDEIEAIERVVDVVATRERIKAGVQVLATACRPSDLSAAFDQFRYEMSYVWLWLRLLCVFHQGTYHHTSLRVLLAPLMCAAH